MQFPPCTRPPGEIARHASQHALLNGIIKEVAIPHDLLSHHWPANRRGLPTSLQGLPLQVDWSPSLTLFVLVDRHSAMGCHQVVSPLYLRRGLDQPWREADTGELVTALLEDGPWREASPNPEFGDQVLQSQAVMASIIEDARRRPHNPLKDYAASEQGLWFGHPNHPTPKARQWPQGLKGQGRDCSPESGLSTRLHQFSFPAQGLRIACNGLEPGEVLSQAADQSAEPEAGRVVLAMHPVQAELFRQAPDVAARINDGSIRDLGRSGPLALPTASMRTWHAPEYPWFIKGSLNVRITNCVRKNAWYELESTLVIDRIMSRLIDSEDPALETLELAREPATLHWAPQDADDDQRRWFREQTGVILRENFCQRFGAERCLLAATVFARDTELEPMAPTLVARASSPASTAVSGAPADDVPEHRIVDWYKAYLGALVEPVLALYFRHGIVVEPHLQNCVLIHDQGWPRRVLLRDFEGVKLTEDQGLDWLAGETLDERVRASMTYSRDKGWKRIAYCLLVNHLAEAILALSWRRPALAERLWAATGEELSRVRQRLGVATPELDVLLAGGDLPCKTNLKLRLMARADRHADYVWLPNPWHQLAGERREVAHG